MITVIIPVYNSSEFLKRCLESVISQTYTDWKIIAVDDGSYDESIQVLEDYRKKDSRIKVLCQKNKGAGAARNTALDCLENNGGYTVFIDSDDYVESNYFELLSKHNEDVVFIDVYQRNEIGYLKKKECISKFKNKSINSITRGQMTGKIPWGVCRKAVKTELILDNRIRCTDDKVGEEAVFSFRTLLKAKTIGFIKGGVYSYVIHSGSLSDSKIDDPWGEVVAKIRDEAILQGVYGDFADTINAFAISACAVSLRRIAKYYSGKVYKNKSLNRIDEMNAFIDRSYCIDIPSLSFAAKVMRILIALKMIWFIKLLSMVY